MFFALGSVFGPGLPASPGDLDRALLPSYSGITNSHSSQRLSRASCAGKTRIAPNASANAVGHAVSAGLMQSLDPVDALGCSRQGQATHQRDEKSSGMPPKIAAMKKYSNHQAEAPPHNMSRQRASRRHRADPAGGEHRDADGEESRLPLRDSWRLSTSPVRETARSTTNNPTQRPRRQPVRDRQS